MHRFRIFFAMLLAVGALSMIPAGGAAQEEVGPDRVYFEQTGHYVQHAFLDYWRANGDIRMFGYPLTEEIQEDGRTVQYFERAVFEWHPDNPAGWKVLLRRLGAQAAAEHENQAAFERSEESTSANVRYYDETGHHLGWGFKEYWDNNGGLPMFGFPLSGEFEQDGLTVQYFERHIFEYHADNPPEWQVLLNRLGAEEAKQNGVDTSALGHDEDVPVYDPDLWYVPEPEPEPEEPVVTPLPGAPSGNAKWIEVDLTNQVLRAWQYDTLVYEAVVSTGLPDTPTNPGTFQTFYHLRTDDMTGGRAGTDDYYYLPDVPHVMYYQSGGYAIHGTYWHNNFGTPQSHGCVNMTQADAEWLYNWTPVGTTVWIH